MEYVYVAIVSSLVSVAVYKYLQINIPIWRYIAARYQDIVNYETDEPYSTSWSTYPKPEYTVSRNGKTKVYSSLKEMPYRDRRHFKEAERQFRAARQQMAMNPFFNKQPGEWAEFKATPITRPISRQKPQPKPESRPKSNKDLN
jgi:hypothetical protein